MTSSPPGGPLTPWRRSTTCDISAASWDAPSRSAGRLKFRVGQIVYVAFDLEETVMGFAFPKEEREALVAGETERFEMPAASDLRFNRVHARLAALEPVEARELVVDAWRLVVLQKVWRAYDVTHRGGPEQVALQGLGPSTG